MTKQGLIQEFKNSSSTGKLEWNNFKKLNENKNIVIIVNAKEVQLATECLETLFKIE